MTQVYSGKVHSSVNDVIRLKGEGRQGSTIRFILFCHSQIFHLDGIYFLQNVDHLYVLWIYALKKDCLHLTDMNLSSV